MAIKLIATDLDGTLLDSQKRISDENRQAVEEAIRRGVVFVPATGRVLAALPDVVMTIKGLRYVITSNGAKIIDLETGEPIYSRFISAETIHRFVALARKEGFRIEIFFGGKAYIDRSLYDEIDRNGCEFRGRDYVMRTRTPVDDILALADEHCDEIENINIMVTDPADIEGLWPLVSDLGDCTLTSSLPINIEVGPAYSSKSEAIKALAEMLGITRDEVMTFGDGPNDIAMLEYAGTGVAMENAWGDTKKYADYIAETNDESGVGKTIRKFVL